MGLTSYKRVSFRNNLYWWKLSLIIKSGGNNVGRSKSTRQKYWGMWVFVTTLLFNNRKKPTSQQKTPHGTTPTTDYMSYVQTATATHTRISSKTIHTRVSNSPKGMSSILSMILLTGCSGSGKIILLLKGKRWDWYR